MRCQWCGNANPATATECASCGRDLASEESTQDAIDRLEDLQFPETDVVCPSCGSHNFIETDFCTLCSAPLHDDAVWPEPRAKPRRPWGDGWSPRAAVIAVIVVGGLVGACFFSSLSSLAETAETARRAEAAREAEVERDRAARLAEIEAARARARQEQEPSALSLYRPPSQGTDSRTQQRALPCVIILPLPSDARLVHTDALSTNSSMVRGQLQYVSSQRAEDVRRLYLYQGSPTSVACDGQGLKPAGEGSGSYRIPGHAEYSLNISVARTTTGSGAAAVSGSRITITWALPTGSSVTAR